MGMKAKGLKKVPKPAKPMDLIRAYMERNAEFTAMLGERTPDEVAYDSVVTAGMRKGHTAEDALRAAAERYPEEAIEWDETNIEEVRPGRSPELTPL
jgi:hypothetical protein